MGWEYNRFYMNCSYNVLFLPNSRDPSSDLQADLDPTPPPPPHIFFQIFAASLLENLLQLQN